jgi:hypothetical protein
MEDKGFLGRVDRQTNVFSLWYIFPINGPIKKYINSVLV